VLLAMLAKHGRSTPMCGICAAARAVVVCKDCQVCFVATGGTAG
jgi:hypothetical protein